MEQTLRETEIQLQHTRQRLQREREARSKTRAKDLDYDMAACQVKEVIKQVATNRIPVVKSTDRELITSGMFIIKWSNGVAAFNPHNTSGREAPLGWIPGQPMPLSNCGPALVLYNMVRKARITPAEKKKDSILITFGYSYNHSTKQGQTETKYEWKDFYFDRKLIEG